MSSATTLVEVENDTVQAWAHISTPNSRSHQTTSAALIRHFSISADTEAEAHSLKSLFGIDMASFFFKATDNQ